MTLSRWRTLAVLAVVVALGIASRRHPIGLPLYDKWLGDVLYAVAAYLVLAICLPRWSPARVATVAFIFCVAVEFFKLTGIPERYAQLAAVRWLLGSRFSWGDIGCYFLGVVLFAGVGQSARSRHSKSGRAEECHLPP